MAARKIKAQVHDKSEWDVGTMHDSQTIELDAWSYVQHKDFQLHLLQKAEEKEQRPRIPATEAQRLTYYRGYVAAPYKLQIFYVQQMAYSSFLWMYATNVFLRSIPTNYLHVFLAAYSPDEHMFGPKMVPICLGLGWQIILTSILQMVYCVDILSILSLYAFLGFFMQSPWDRCKHPTLHSPLKNVTMHCFQIDEFQNITQSHYANPNLTKVHFFGQSYKFGNTSRHFTAAPMAFFVDQLEQASWMERKSITMLISFCSLWILAAACYKILYTKHVWKTLVITSWCVQLISFTVTIFILIAFAYDKVQPIAREYDAMQVRLTLGWDFDMQGESITAPPIVQLLTSRSLDPISPGRDSTLITASNTVIYIYRGLVNYVLKSYVEATSKISLLVSWTNPYPIFYFWPFFFHKVILGKFALRIFYLISFSSELCVFVITYQILIEVITCEWKWMRRFYASVLVTMTGIALNLLLHNQVKQNLYIISSAITSLSEVVMVCWLYPSRRFFDDVHFQFGVPILYIRKWGMRILPFYQAYKVYTIYDTFLVWNSVPHLQWNAKYVKALSDNSSYKWAWMVPVVPIPLGILVAIVKYICWQGKSWSTLVKPLPTWGPREYATRQFRKEFDSRDYIGSQASRFLSRHLLAKAQTASYKLDLNYDVPRASVRHSIVADHTNSSKMFDDNDGQRFP